jgi:hypothetical protein
MPVASAGSVTDELTFLLGFLLLREVSMFRSLLFFRVKNHC